MKIGVFGFYVLNEGKNRGQSRPALITNLYKVPADYRTGETHADGSPKWAVRQEDRADLTIFPSMQDGFTTAVQWRVGVPVDKKDESGGHERGTFYVEDAAPTKASEALTGGPEDTAKKADGAKAETAGKQETAPKATTAKKTDGAKAETAGK